MIYSNLNFLYNTKASDNCGEISLCCQIFCCESIELDDKLEKFGKWVKSLRRIREEEHRKWLKERRKWLEEESCFRYAFAYFKNKSVAGGEISSSGSESGETSSSGSESGNELFSCINCGKTQECNQCVECGREGICYSCYGKGDFHKETGWICHDCCWRLYYIHTGEREQSDEDTSDEETSVDETCGEGIVYAFSCSRCGVFDKSRHHIKHKKYDTPVWSETDRKWYGIPEHEYLCDVCHRKDYPEKYTGVRDYGGQSDEDTSDKDTSDEDTSDDEVSVDDESSDDESSDENDDDFGTEYKCRIEFPGDIKNLRRVLGDDATRIRQHKSPGTVYSFFSTLPLQRLKQILNESELDLHVAGETIKPIAEYTGVRDYGGQSEEDTSDEETSDDGWICRTSDEETSDEETSDEDGPNWILIENCVICQDNVSGQYNTCILPCGHFFHYTCMQDWCKRAKNDRKDAKCPLCQATIEARGKSYGDVGFWDALRRGDDISDEDTSDENDDDGSISSGSEEVLSVALPTELNARRNEFDEVICDECEDEFPQNCCYLCGRENICENCEGYGGDYGENEEWVCYHCLPFCLVCGEKLRNVDYECCGQGRSDFEVDDEGS